MSCACGRAPTSSSGWSAGRRRSMIGRAGDRGCRRARLSVGPAARRRRRAGRRRATEAGRPGPAAGHGGDEQERSQRRPFCCGRRPACGFGPRGSRRGSRRGDEGVGEASPRSVAAPQPGRLPAALGALRPRPRRHRQRDQPRSGHPTARRARTPGRPPRPATNSPSSSSPTSSASTPSAARHAAGSPPQ